MKKSAKILAFVLTFIMLVGVLVTSVFAVQQPDLTTPTVATRKTYNDFEGKTILADATLSKSEWKGSGGSGIQLIYDGRKDGKAETAIINAGTDLENTYLRVQSTTVNSSGGGAYLAFGAHGGYGANNYTSDFAVLDFDFGADMYRVLGSSDTVIITGISGTQYKGGALIAPEDLPEGTDPSLYTLSYNPSALSFAYNMIYQSISFSLSMNADNSWKLTLPQMNNASVALSNTVGEWNHITIIIDEVGTSDVTNYNQASMYVYMNGEYVGHNSFADMGYTFTSSTALSEFRIGSSSANGNVSMAFDNIVGNTYAKGYAGDLATAFASNAYPSNLSVLSDITFSDEYVYPSPNKPIAKIGNTEYYTAYSVSRNLYEGCTLTLFNGAKLLDFEPEFSFNVVCSQGDFSLSSDTYVAIYSNGAYTVKIPDKFITANIYDSLNVSSPKWTKSLAEGRELNLSDCVISDLIDAENKKLLKHTGWTVTGAVNSVQYALNHVFTASEIDAAGTLNVRPVFEEKDIVYAVRDASGNVIAESDLFGDIKNLQTIINSHANGEIFVQLLSDINDTYTTSGDVLTVGSDIKITIDLNGYEWLTSANTSNKNLFYVYSGSPTINIGSSKAGAGLYLLTPAVNTAENAFVYSVTSGTATVNFGTVSGISGFDGANIEVMAQSFVVHNNSTGTANVTVNGGTYIRAEEACYYTYGLFSLGSGALNVDVDNATIKGGHVVSSVNISNTAPITATFDNCVIFGGERFGVEPLIYSFNPVSKATFTACTIGCPLDTGKAILDADNSIAGTETYEDYVPGVTSQSAVGTTFGTIIMGAGTKIMEPNHGHGGYCYYVPVVLGNNLKVRPINETLDMSSFMLPFPSTFRYGAGVGPVGTFGADGSYEKIATELNKKTFKLVYEFTSDTDAYIYTTDNELPSSYVIVKSGDRLDLSGYSIDDKFDLTTLMIKKHIGWSITDSNGNVYYDDHIYTAEELANTVCIYVRPVFEQVKADILYTVTDISGELAADYNLLGDIRNLQTIIDNNADSEIFVELLADVTDAYTAAGNIFDINSDIIINIDLNGYDWVASTTSTASNYLTVSGGNPTVNIYSSNADGGFYFFTPYKDSNSIAFINILTSGTVDINLGSVNGANGDNLEMMTQVLIANTKADVNINISGGQYIRSIENAGYNWGFMASYMGTMNVDVDNAFFKGGCIVASVSLAANTANTITATFDNTTVIGAYRFGVEPVIHALTPSSAVTFTNCILAGTFDTSINILAGNKNSISGSPAYDPLTASQDALKPGAETFGKVIMGLGTKIIHPDNGHSSYAYYVPIVISDGLKPSAVNETLDMSSFKLSFLPTFKYTDGFGSIGTFGADGSYAKVEASLTDPIFNIVYEFVEIKVTDVFYKVDDELISGVLLDGVHQNEPSVPDIGNNVYFKIAVIGWALESDPTVIVDLETLDNGAILVPVYGLVENFKVYANMVLTTRISQYTYAPHFDNKNDNTYTYNGITYTVTVNNLRGYYGENPDQKFIIDGVEYYGYVADFGAMGSTALSNSDNMSVTLIVTIEGSDGSVYNFGSENNITSPLSTIDYYKKALAQYNTEVTYKLLANSARYSYSNYYYWAASRGASDPKVDEFKSFIESEYAEYLVDIGGDYSKDDVIDNFALTAEQMEIVEGVKAVIAEGGSGVTYMGIKFADGVTPVSAHYSVKAFATINEDGTININNRWTSSNMLAQDQFSIETSDGYFAYGNDHMNVALLSGMMRFDATATVNGVTTTVEFEYNLATYIAAIEGNNPNAANMMKTLLALSETAYAYIME